MGSVILIYGQGPSATERVQQVDVLDEQLVKVEIVVLWKYCTGMISRVQFREVIG